MIQNDKCHICVDKTDKGIKIKSILIYKNTTFFDSSRPSKKHGHPQDNRNCVHILLKNDRLLYQFLGHVTVYKNKLCQ